VLVGEVGLGGEIRPVSSVERRLAEAAQLGFTQAFVSGRGLPRRAIDRLRVTGVDSIARLLELLFR
jgi:DNA repair protein RadA/Sms